MSQSQKESACIGRYGLHRTEPYLSFEAVRVLAERFGIKVHRFDEDQWHFVWKGRLVHHWPSRRAVQLVGVWSGSREGDYAVAMMVTLTGHNPIEREDYRLCNIIRMYNPSSHLIEDEAFDNI